MLKDYRTVWEGCLRSIAVEIGEQSYQTWFRPIVPVSLEGQVLTVQVPSYYFYEFLEEHYVDELRRAVYQELGPAGELNYNVVMDQGNEQAQPKTLHLPPARKTAPDEAGTPPPPRASNALAAVAAPVSAAYASAAHGSLGRAAQPRYSASGANAAAGRGKAAVAAADTATLRNPFDYARTSAQRPASQLNAAYTFDNYIEGGCNRLARAASVAVANKSGTTSFNPLMIYGGVGLGKTHLVQAIGNHIQATAPEKTVIYVSAEKFTNQFIENIKLGKVEDFGSFYMQADALILDDVQFLANKDKTQEMFFHIFNHLHQSGKQIVLTSDQPPKDLKGLQERLLSRFKWGLTADVQSPDFETRVAIIHNKMEQDGIDLPPNHVIDYLANSVHTNVRELEGVIASLVAQSSLARREIDLEMVKQALRHIIEEVEAEVNLDFIQKTVAAYFGTTVELLKDKTRKKEVVTARQVAMYFAKHHTAHTLKTIGFHFGGRDHTTVMHSVQTVSDLVDSDRKFREQVEELRKKFGAA